MKTCLVIIFNHRFDNNIHKLKELYKKRFSCIRILMPFYHGSDPDVIPVYESSYEFQGMAAQAREKLMELDCDYYFFISDDLILNPAITEVNFMEELNLQMGESLHRGVFELQKSLWEVERINDAIECFEVQKHTQYQAELMNSQDAIDKMKSYGGYGNIEITKEDKSKWTDWKGFKNKYGRQKIKMVKDRIKMPYPLLGGGIPTGLFCRERIWILLLVNLA